MGFSPRYYVSGTLSSVLSVILCTAFGSKCVHNALLPVVFQEFVARQY